MSLHDYLLTDDQMRRFIANGYLVLQTDFPAAFHEGLNAKLEEVMTKEGNPGNNILPRLSEVNQVFQHPVIQGALTSVVGPGYVMHPHRHCHYTFPGRKVQGWHKDSYWGYQKVRNHHNWWAMIFYYPQDVDSEMGPSGILNGTQYYAKRPGDETERQEFLKGPAGTFALIHYDLWHRGGANLSTRNRAMMKFQFVRMAAPSAPAWNNDQVEWTGLNGDSPPHDHTALWRHHWNWHRGATEDLRRDDSPQEDLVPRLASGYEPEGVDAAYRLAAGGEGAVGPLLDSLTSGNGIAARNAGYGLSAVGPAAVEGLVAALRHENEDARNYAAFALGELRGSRPEGAAALAAAVTDPSDHVRRTVAEALGTVDAPAQSSVPALIRSLHDSDGQVRFTAALSLQRLGPAAEEAVPALTTALQDENRYVRANAVDALRRIGTPAALQAALEHLSAHRWCPTTTPENTF